MTVRDVNEFVDGLAHEAVMKGSIRFARFQGRDNVTFALDERSSLFNYLIVNRASFHLKRAIVRDLVNELTKVL
jgi:hypothetical protein